MTPVIYKMPFFVIDTSNNNDVEEDRLLIPEKYEHDISDIVLDKNWREKAELREDEGVLYRWEGLGYVNVSDFQHSENLKQAKHDIVEEEVDHLADDAEEERQDVWDSIYIVE